MRLRSHRAPLEPWSSVGLLLTASLLALLLGVVSCQHGASGGARGRGLPALMDAATAVDEVDRRWVVIDARPRSKCEASHASGAFCMPLEALLPHPPWQLGRGARARLGRHMAQAGAEWDTPILVIAGSGSSELQRGAAVCWLSSLVETGDCHVLAGGLAAWKRAGGSVVEGPGRRAGRRGAAPLHVPSAPLTWADEAALRHATIEPDVAIVQVGSAGPGPKVPGAYGLSPEDILSSRGAPSSRAMMQRLADRGILAEEQVVVLGSGLQDGALGWFLLDRVAGLAEVRLYPGGLARYRKHAQLPLMHAEKPRGKRPSEGGAKLDDREVGG